MRSTLLTTGLGFLALFAVVQGCSGDESPTQPRATTGGAAPGPSGGAGSGSPGTPGTPGGPSRPDGGVDAGDGGAKSAMTFFVSSTPGGDGGKLGGLTGADTRCQALAVAAEGGDHTWHAYLSATVQAQVTNAKDRIGPGPWKNQKGTVIAASVATLHAEAFNVKGADLFDEKGVLVPVNRHDIFTGSKRDGTLFTPEQTCSAWTSNTAASGGDDNADRGFVGHTDSDTNENRADAWNSAHGVGCAANQLIAANGEGRLYCFAID